MEKNKNVKIALLIVTMLIITITSVAATAVMYKLLMDTKNESQQNISISDNSNNKVEEENTTENSFTTYQENYQETLKEIMGKENEISIYIGEGRDYELPGVERVYVDVNNDAYFEFKEGSELYSKYGETLKVESGVANVFVYPTGSGGNSEVIFLKLDGTASSVHGFYIEQNKVVEVEKVEGVENAVNVISYFRNYYNEDGGYEGTTPTVVYIDVNGNVIK